MVGKRIIGLLVALTVLSFSLAHAEPIVIYTENYPPYNQLSDQGEVVGLATENVRQVMSLTGLEFDIRLVPWARAVQYVKDSPNVLIYSITRTPSRESSYAWLVPLAKSSFYIFNRGKDIRPVTIEAIQAGTFTGACVINDLGCDLFRDLGMPADKLLRISDRTTGDFRMVIAERADLYVSDINANRRLRSSENFDLTLTKPVMRLEGNSQFYLAGSKNLDNDVREAIVAVYETLKRNNAYQLADPNNSKSTATR